MVIGLGVEEKKEILGFWINKKESSGFWLGVLNDLMSRGDKRCFYIQCG